MKFNITWQQIFQWMLKRLKQLPGLSMGKKLFGIQFVDFFNIPMERRLQTLAVFQWTICFIYLGLEGFLFMIFLLFTPLAILVLPYLAWYFYDKKTPERGGRRSDWVRSWRVWHYFRDYFPIKLHKTAELDPSKNYLMLYHPHGIMVHGAFASFATDALGFKDLYPGMKPTMLSLAYQFFCPLNRDYCMQFGVCSCSKASIEWLLSKAGTGNAVVLVVGGASEALEARPGSLTLTIANRKGFARIALEQGVSLVPIFSFGETDIYDQLPNPEGSRLRKFQRTLQKYLTFSPPFFHGRGIFNYTIGMMPYRRPINVVVGAPLEVKQISHPTDEQVEELHDRYIKCLTELFESNKSKYGLTADRHLNFI